MIESSGHAELVDINTGEISSTPLGVCPECKRTAFADLVAALGELAEPGKGGKANVGGRGTYTYLTLPDQLTAARPTLAKHHLAVMQEVTNDGHTVSVVTVLLHASGYAFRSPQLTLPAGSGPQGVGSASTYGRRYTLAAMVGLAGEEDDDAQQVKPARPDSRPAPPPDQRGGRVAPGTASPQSVKMMWTLLRQTGMSDAELRVWVAAVLQVPEQWHTADLSQSQVSQLIERLKTAPRAAVIDIEDEDGRLPGP